MPYGQVPHAEKHGVRIGLDISAVVFVIHLTKIKVKKIHPWVLWLEAYIPIMGWLTYQYYMTGAYKRKTKTKQISLHPSIEIHYDASATQLCCINFKCLLMKMFLISSY